MTHHEGLERGVELADPRPGTRGSGHDVLLRVAAVPDQLLELLDARLLDVRGLLQVLNLPIHGGAVGLGEARVLRLGDLLGGLGLLGVVGDGVGDRSVLDRVGLSLGIGGDGVHVDGGVVLGGGHLREKVVGDLVSGGGFVATQKRLVGERRKRAFTAACWCVLEEWCGGPWKDVRSVVPARRERRISRSPPVKSVLFRDKKRVDRHAPADQSVRQPLLLPAPPLFSRDGQHSGSNEGTSPGRRVAAGFDALDPAGRRGDALPPRNARIAAERRLARAPRRALLVLRPIPPGPSRSRC